MKFKNQLNVGYVNDYVDDERRVAAAVDIRVGDVRDDCHIVRFA